VNIGSAAANEFFAPSKGSPTEKKRMIIGGSSSSFLNARRETFGADYLVQGTMRRTGSRAADS